jgi:predicted 2-oxoglutarate/Fe(II)-dependent dioxygenase YbiX
MPNIQQQLTALLERIDRPGDFYATGTLAMHPPRLRVEGVGTIALPLLPVQAEQLIAIAEQAPYGRGSETLVDTQVRRTWQIDAARLTLEGQRWSESLAHLLAQIAEDLGVTGEVEAELYKLLIYDAGSFFVSHRDSEKCPGMFATLVMILPSEFSGGELIVKHQSREVRLDLRREDPAAIAYAAFYADCRHQVLPITDGCRLALIYNLFRRDGGPLPQAPDHDSARSALTQVLSQWNQREASGDARDHTHWPRKLVLPLAHAYTEAELGFRQLKGIDATLGAMLRDAATAADCDLHLAMLSVHESGWAEYCGYSRWGEDFEIGEVDERTLELHTWRRPDGSASTMGALPFDEQEICPPSMLEEIADTEAEFHEATGNEGVSFERQYQCAALVLWPRRQRGAVLAPGGLDLSLPWLTELLAGIDAAGATEASDSEDLLEARALAQTICAHWPADDFRRRNASRKCQSAQFLSALHRLGDTRTTVDFIATVLAAGGYGALDNPPLIAILGDLPAEHAGTILETLITGNAQRDPSACAGLLAEVLARHPGLAGNPVSAAALALLDALPITPPGPSYSGASPKVTPELVTATLAALQHIDAAADSAPADPPPQATDHQALGLKTFGRQALARFLDHPDTYDPDQILIPAALAIQAGAAPLPADTPLAEQFKDALITLLRRRIAAPLEPPADWRRPAQLRCQCPHCQQLSRFLNSPTDSTWRLKAVKKTREHVTAEIGQARCDLDLKTETRGTPHTLICTKNQASYAQALRQRAADSDHLLALDDSTAAGATT